MICRCKRTRKRTNNKFQQRKRPGPFWSTSALASARVPFCCYLQMHTRMREVKEGFHVISRGTNSVLLPSQVFTVAICQSYGKDINFVSTRLWHRQHCVCGVFWFGHWTFLNVNVLSRRQGRARSPWHTLDLISHFTLGLLILVASYIYIQYRNSTK